MKRRSKANFFNMLFKSKQKVHGAISASGKDYGYVHYIMRKGRYLKEVVESVNVFSMFDCWNNHLGLK